MKYYDFVVGSMLCIIAGNALYTFTLEWNVFYAFETLLCGYLGFQSIKESL